MCSTTAHDFSGLSNISLVGNLSHAQLTQLSERLHGNVYPAGTTLMTGEQPGEVGYFIRSGTVKVHVDQADGHNLIISILGQDECVGEMSPLDQI